MLDWRLVALYGRFNISIEDHNDSYYWVDITDDIDVWLVARYLIHKMHPKIETVEKIINYHRNTNTWIDSEDLNLL